MVKILARLLSIYRKRRSKMNLCKDCRHCRPDREFLMRLSTRLEFAKCAKVVRILHARTDLVSGKAVAASEQMHYCSTVRSIIEGGKGDCSIFEQTPPKAPKSLSWWRWITVPLWGPIFIVMELANVVSDLHTKLRMWRWRKKND